MHFEANKEVRGILLYLSLCCIDDHCLSTVHMIRYVHPVVTVTDLRGRPSVP